MTITGSNTFNTFQVDASDSAKGITATGTTQTVSSFINPNSPNGITITGGTWTKVGGGQVGLCKATVSSSTGSPVNTWFAGQGSTNGGGNTAWYFYAPAGLFGTSI